MADCCNFEAMFCIKKFYSNGQYSEIFSFQHYSCKIHSRIEAGQDPERFFWSLVYASEFNHIELGWFLASVKKSRELSVVTLRHTIVIRDIKPHLTLILKYTNKWKKEKGIFSTSAFVQRSLNHRAEMQDEMETTEILWPFHSSH